MTRAWNIYLYRQVWDLNVLDGLEPVATLGPTDDSSPYTHPEGHKDAVMALAWNRLQRNVRGRPVPLVCSSCP